MRDELDTSRWVARRHAADTRRMEDDALVVRIVLRLAHDETSTERGGTFTNCVTTEDRSPIESGIVETKCYAAGVVFVLGINQTTGERPELVRIIDRP